MRDLVLRPLWKIGSLKVTGFFFFFKKKGGGGGGGVGEKKNPPFPRENGLPSNYDLSLRFVKGMKGEKKERKKRKRKKK